MKDKLIFVYVSIHKEREQRWNQTFAAKQTQSNPFCPHTELKAGSLSLLSKQGSELV